MDSNANEDDVLDLWTTIKLAPSYQGRDCIANGENPSVECCCDACDFFLVCFPEWENRGNT